MPAVAVKGGSILGMTTGEHGGHTNPNGTPMHGPGTLTGTITSGTDKLRINGIFVALEDEDTEESDNCDSDTGKLGNIEHKLKVNGKSVQCLGDNTKPHNGTAKISTGNSKITTV
ncbi:MAG: hypothetical protein K0Q47_155 [Sedimentibacter sp.]|jgi:uncharacterized Zn-binding protein involved in type VI secretion|nr:hypothetical protein [Sedimentibacter sp.]